MVQLIRILVFFTPMVHNGPVSRRAPNHNSLRYQAEGYSPIQSGVQTLPFLLSIVVCEYGLLFTRKLITKIKILAAIISGALVKVQYPSNMRKLHDTKVQRSLANTGTL